MCIFAIPDVGNVQTIIELCPLSHCYGRFKILLIWDIGTIKFGTSEKEVTKMMYHLCNLNIQISVANNSFLIQKYLITFLECR